MVFIRCPFLKNVKIINDDEEFTNVNSILNNLHHKTGICLNSTYLYYNGKPAQECEKIPKDGTIDVCFPTLGGKGGFGSMLRAIGAQIEKTTNREACRDLSGRRLRDINEEQRLKRWLAKKAEREVEQLKRKKERLERLKDLPKHEFHDPEYNKERSELPERIDNALSQGLKKASVLGKKPSQITAGEPSTKKKRLWLEEDLLSDLEDLDSSGDDSKEPSKIEPSTSSQDSEASSETINESESVVHQEPDTRCSSWDNSHSSKMEASEETVESVSENEEKVTAELPIEKANAENNMLENSQERQLPSVKKSETTEEELPHKVASEEKDEIQVDLLEFKSVEELEEMGLEKLKTVLTNMGLKCGGTLSERASRLWSVRGLDSKDYPKSLKAKTKK